MFSGLTNQVSSLFSKNADEQVPTPPQSATGEGEQAPIPSTDAVAGDNAENPEKQRYVIEKCHIEPLFVYVVDVA